MLRVLRGLPVFNGRYQLQAWIARIATNVSVDMVRARARRPVVDSSRVVEEDHHDPDPSPELAYERLVERDLVISVLSTLPETHRTALVLRELEGRSHREIAKTLELTPSQAKALIHRAKSSFRRGWLRAMADRGGVAGIAMLPVFWLMRGVDGVRRVVDKIGGHVTQVAQAATPEVVSSTAASPAAAVVTSVSERVVAASMAVLLAGGVTVGAATLATHNRSDREKAAQSGTVAAPPVQEAESAPVAPPPVRTVRHVRPKHHHKVVPAIPAVEVPTTTDESTTGTDDVPATETDAGTTPTEGSDSVPPVVVPPPAPEWSYGFSSSVDSVEACACDGSSTASGSRIQQLAEGGFSFAQVIRGGAGEAGGDIAWPFSLQQWGQVGPLEGQIDYRFRLTSSAGVFLYYGSGVLAEMTPGDDGSTMYRFEGTFDLVTTRTVSPGLPSRGFASITMGVWQDGTIYAGSLALQDAIS
jgi:RNA polymerase sigma factor (sigma-70 family)